MIKIPDIILNDEQIAKEKNPTLYAVGISDGFEYVDGKRTDNQTHKKVEVVLPKNKYEKITVKLPGVKHPITAEMIAQNGGMIKVRFSNFTGRFYRTNSGDYALTCKADGVEVLA